jgi:hypothetical protein
LSKSHAALPSCAGAIKIGITPIAGLNRSFKMGPGQRAKVALFRHRKGSVLPVEIIRAARLVFGLPEIRQDIVITPPGITKLAPVVVIRCVPANINHAIDRARPAQHLAPRLDNAAPVAAWVWLGGVAPVHARICKRPAIPKGYVDPRVRVLAARLEQQHAILTAFSEPVRQYAAGTTCPTIT